MLDKYVGGGWLGGQLGRKQTKSQTIRCFRSTPCTSDCPELQFCTGPVLVNLCRHTRQVLRLLRVIFVGRETN